MELQTSYRNYLLSLNLSNLVIIPIEYKNRDSLSVAALQHIGAHVHNYLCICCLNNHYLCCSGLSTSTIGKLHNEGQLTTGSIVVSMEVVDHRHSIRNGGNPFPRVSDDPVNGDLVSLCLACHSRKHRVDNLDSKMVVIERNMKDLNDWA